MGQIFNRIKEIAKSKLNTDEPFSGALSEDVDDELRRIINELDADNRNSDSKFNEDFKERQKKAHSEAEPKLMLDETLACRILEIRQGASEEQIKSAYRKMIKEYHPDKVQTLGAEIKALAAKKSLEINEAYKFLQKIRCF